MFAANQIPPVRFSREMGYTHEEFRRLLPAAAAPYQVNLTGTRALVEDGERKLVITLHPQTERRIASLTIPATRVDFAFLGFSDLFYQRGGG